MARPSRSRTRRPRPPPQTHTGVSGAVETDGNGNSTVYLQAGTIADVLNAIDLATGVQTATLAAGGATFAAAAGQTKSSINSSGALQISHRHER